jgi:hypothetical protein
MKKLVLTLFIATIMLSATDSMAQRFRKKNRYWSVGGSLGASNYVGDLDPGQSFVSPAFQFTRSHIGASLVHRFAPRLSWRAALGWNRVKGDDAVASTTTGDDVFRNIRNLSFRNDLYELKGDLIIDLFENRRGLERRVHFTPYAFLGLGVFWNNPKTEFKGQWVALQPLGTEGQNIDGLGVDGRYSKIQVEFPIGIGVRYKLNRLWDIAFEIGWRFTTTDYIDDVSGNYVDKAKLGSIDSDVYLLSDRSLERPLPGVTDNYQFTRTVDGTTHTYYSGYGNSFGPQPNKRGDANRDWFVVSAFHLTYILAPRIICPKFRG